MLRKYKPCIIFFYAAAIITLIFASFYDLTLDIRLNNPDNIIAVWFRNTGEIPCRLICPIAGTIIFYTSEKYLSKTSGIIVTLTGAAYFGYYIGKYFFVDEYKMVFSILWGLGFGICTLIVGRFITIPENIRPSLRIIAIFGIAVMFIQLGAIEIMKYLWGRVRYRDLLTQGSYSSFTPWYIINGINGNKSFPSGHTAGAGMSYLMMFLPFLSNKCKDKSFLCFLVPFIYTSVVAVTRLVMGAHYLSDVTMGAIVSFSIVITAIYIYEKRFLKKRNLLYFVG